MFYKQNDDKKELSKNACANLQQNIGMTQKEGGLMKQREIQRNEIHINTQYQCAKHTEWRIDKILKNGGIDTCML